MASVTPSDGEKAERLTTLQSLALVFRSRRTAAVALQMFFSGMPLGLVWIAIPAWLARLGVDLRAIGLITLTQAPWTFKFLWAPLMDRYSPPFLGRKRGWMVIGQAALLALLLIMAGVAIQPDTPEAAGGVSLDWVWVVGALTLAVALASTVQDIAIDAYAVEILRKEEHGIAVGARTALYRVGMYLAGAVAISLAAETSWALTLSGLGLLYLVGIAFSVWSPDVEMAPPAPRSLRDAVWDPLVSLLGRSHALEIIAFLFLYKFGDNVAQALLRPFLVQMNYSDFDVGIATGTIGLFGMIGGTFIGGLITTRIGLGHSLWIFGVLQAVSNVGYIWIASIEPSRPVMYAAMGFETLTQGTGTGAFFVLLLRLTDKRFSATQYALLSSIFALGRVVTGPMAGFLVDAMGWRIFFVLTIIGSVPGLAFLHRFVPLGSREPVIAPEAPSEKAPLGNGALASRGAAGFAGGLVVAALVSASLSAVKAWRAAPEAGFPIVSMLQALARPGSLADWITTAGVALFAVVTGLATAALLYARRRAHEGLATGADA